MKKPCQILFLILVLLVSLSGVVAAQKDSSTTIILVRHAEKDTSAAGSTAMQADPPLSAAGKIRSEKLVEVLKSYPIQAIFSTKYNRTRSTAMPIAAKLGVEIQIYEPGKQADLASILKSWRGKTVLVVGHSNTVPGLVNLLTGNSNYPNLGDNEYDKMYIVRFENGKSTYQQISY
jgi:2,3-bisphosphoglycerate-dependent phosphoglycerate mutase